LNYDISTPEGMENAKRWQEQQVARVMQGGLWAVPRSGTVIRIDHENKVASMFGLLPEPEIVKVFVAMGWTVKGEGHEPEK
jgi:hypothetical protein